jgi:hypothetical protein
MLFAVVSNGARVFRRSPSATISSLCQEEPCLLELVRYIHLNPLRAKQVATLKQPD